MSGGTGSEGPTEYSVAPIFERSSIDTDGQVEIAVSMWGGSDLGTTELDVFLRQSRIDPGDHLEMGIFVSGVRDIEEVSLSLFYDHDDVIDLDDPGVVRRNTGTGTDTDDDTDGEADRAAESELSAFRRGKTVEEHAMRREPLEGNHRAAAAYILELNTRARAPPGTYRLPVVFTYQSERGIKQVKRVPTVRLNNWRERREPWVTRSAIVTLMLAVLGVMYAVTI
ncbi:hypothetical protein [Halopiger djelfimassiliensis]|uniref:hypothetical protein n=1 Tax=Halopiger djelfimassiliensis TaxID=1293047 RepID=UPI000677D370|nr:hypothetical protein [Halopiger djelfimassiliensis]